MNLETIIMEKADVLAHEARILPHTAHIAQMWMLNARGWAERHGKTALTAHLNMRISALTRFRMGRLCGLSTVWSPCETSQAFIDRFLPATT